MTFNITAERALFLSLIFLLVSCRAYKQDILFQLDEDFSENSLSEPVSRTLANYRLQPDDQLKIDVFTNKGERIIDPNFELVEQGQNFQQRKEFQYLIQVDGTVKLPIIGTEKVSGLNLYEAEEKLEGLYDAYYKESFVKLTIMNRRVVVLGANGGQVINIQNENTSLVEVLALYGGFEMGAKAGNIKLIRGELTNPEVYRIDLSTVSGMQSTILEVESGDIIYVEPWRRPWLESLRDISPILGVTTSILTLIVVIQNL